MESRQALRGRFELAPRILYEMIYVRRREGAGIDGAMPSSGGRNPARPGIDGAMPSNWPDDFVGVRDHTAILEPDGRGVIVHLSHNLIAPPARRTGLAGWMRALPIAAARECLATNGINNGGKDSSPKGGKDSLSSNARITLIAEMEHHVPDHPHEMARLQAYEKAGFRKIDPTRVNYHQPDFRTPAEIDAGGGPHPLPLQLIVRRVGREHERVISGGEARRLARALYEIYGFHFRASDMAHRMLSLEGYPADDATIALVPPTQ